MCVISVLEVGGSCSNEKEIDAKTHNENTWKLEKQMGNTDNMKKQIQLQIATHINDQQQNMTSNEKKS